MNTVIVRPERCVGCLQCRLACAVEHSRTKSLAAAIHEDLRPRPRLRVYPGRQRLAFPSKCRHCAPAPCQQVCIAGAIYRDEDRGAVDIDPHRCINCAMCAMACPFGVLTYAPLFQAPEKRAVALKCDQCPAREQVGRVPACVEACKVGALTYGQWQAAQDAKGRAVAQAFFASLPSAEETTAFLPLSIRRWRQLG
ncbi:MAG: 4Fe-4S dicluster domain-containing protein [Deltaproteobacteria bacterium]|nr:4Fe-4S dicluster domain-containing protein [Deltaproteobacteria bacterium]